MALGLVALARLALVKKEVSTLLTIRNLNSTFINYFTGAKGRSPLVCIDEGLRLGIHPSKDVDNLTIVF